MNLNNAYLVYKILHKEYNADRRMMTMPEAMKEATHVLLQTCDNMRTLDAVHPPSRRDMTNAYDSTTRAFRSDCKGGTTSNNNIRQGAGAIASPLSCKKPALQMK